MRKVGRLLDHQFYSYKTLQHRGRVFSFRKSVDRRLIVLEVVLGEKAAVDVVFTKTWCERLIGCCSFGSQILVISGEARTVCACLISVDDGPLTESSVHIRGLKVERGELWHDIPFLFRVSETRALLCFGTNTSLWFRDLTASTLKMTKSDTALPVETGFGSVVCLPDGKLLVAGSVRPSTDITVISANGNPTVEKVGDIPGAERAHASYVLVKDRFLIGFGGYNRSFLADLWIFDLQTRNSSVIWEKGKWHPGDVWVSLIAWRDAIYLIGGKKSKAISSITFRALAELIHEETVRKDFCTALGLPSAPRCDIFRLSNLYSGMKRLRGSLRDWRSHNTVCHQGRVFHSSQSGGELVVSELLFGPRLKPISVHIGLYCKADNDTLICCCSVREKILVMAGKQGGFDCFAALVSVEDGEFGRNSVRVTELAVKGCEEWSSAPLLAQTKKNQVWLSFLYQDAIWICVIRKSGLKMQRSVSTLPLFRGFGTPPISLPGKERKFLVAGTWLLSNDITIITPGRRFAFEKIESAPGRGRYCTTSILVGERFVVGFGGFSDKDVNDLWIFDLLTRVSSSVKKEGAWHPATSWAFLDVRDETLYLFSGQTTATAHYIHLASLASLISDRKMKLAFLAAAGLPVNPLCEYTQQKLGFSAAVCL